jgi:hypothetical protein
MPQAVKVMQCEYCGRRTVAKLVNDIAGPGENCYECQYCFQIHRELSTGGTLLALGLLGLAIASEVQEKNR